MNISISALITNYNTSSLTLHCLQAFEHWSKDKLSEILIIDDGSEKTISTLYDKVRIIRNEKNRGYVASVNIGFYELNEDIVFLFDSDAYPLMDLTLPVANAFEQDPELGALGFKLVNLNGQATGSSQPVPTALGLLVGQQIEGWYHARFQSKDTNHLVLYSCAVAIRRKAFKDIGGFDESFDFLDADIDFFLRLRTAGWNFYVDSRLIAFHEGKGSFQKTSTRVLRYHHNRWRFLQKHGLLPRARLFRYIFKLGLLIRHIIEYGILLILGKFFIHDFAVLKDKLYCRKQLLAQAWSGYGNEY